MNSRRNINKIITLIIILCIIMIFVFMNCSYAAATQYTQSLRSGIDEFPSEYQGALERLKDMHPNWTFEAYNTGLSWDTLILNETATHGRNRVIKSSEDSWY